MIYIDRDNLGECIFCSKALAFAQSVQIINKGLVDVYFCDESICPFFGIKFGVVRETGQLLGTDIEGI